MREINTLEITRAVKELCIFANCHLPDDVKKALVLASENEESAIGKSIINTIIKNYKIGEEESLAICQDTGVVIVFCEIGQNVHIIGGNIEESINEGVRQAYKEGFFRNSVISDPLLRSNTEDNTPAIIYYEIVSGDKLKITAAPKGFGSENMSALKMLKPSDGTDGVIGFVLETIENAGASPCPPIVVGIGIGGTMDKAALLAKKALLRSLDSENKEEHIARLEKKLLDLINNLGIGPQGLGGRITALKVNIETYPTHIAGLPVAVNIGCHVNRHASREI
ncbi:MAG: fumarate hydratase [Deltaproteobacteria bacterium]